jgi:hypothetical protein
MRRNLRPPREAPQEHAAWFEQETLMKSDKR